MDKGKKDESVEDAALKIVELVQDMDAKTSDEYQELHSQIENIIFGSRFIKGSNG